MSQIKSYRCPAGRQLQTEGGTGRWGPADEAANLLMCQGAEGVHDGWLIDTDVKVVPVVFTARAVCGGPEGGGGLPDLPAARP